MKKFSSPSFDPTNWLRERRLKATKARMAIVEALHRSSVPMTLKDLHSQVKNTGCDFATVFRFVSLLETKKLVERVAWIDGTSRHEIRHEDGHHHHHYLICRECHKVEPIEECVVERLENQIGRERGYVGLDHSLQLSGVCPACQKGNKRQRK